MSIAGGLRKAAERAAGLGCTTFQIFCGNPRGWALQRRHSSEIGAFRKAVGSASLGPLFVHSCYLVNPCAASDETFKKSTARMAAELRLCSLIGAHFYVLHPGSHKGRPAGWGVQRAADSISAAVGAAGGAVPVALETTASLHGPGGTFERLAELVGALRRRCPPQRFSLCVDSCHVFAAGYNLRRDCDVERMVSDIAGSVGLDSVALLHLNDSRDEPGSRRDRHEHIGKGRIGTRGLKRLLNHPRLTHLPLILETPWISEEVDMQNLEAARKLARSS